LGITVSFDLYPTLYINDVVAKAHKRALAILRIFISRDVGLLTRAYIVYVSRPLLEYTSVTWSPYTLQDIEAVERVQHAVLRGSVASRNCHYQERLRYLTYVCHGSAQPRITLTTDRFNLELQDRFWAR